MSDVYGKAVTIVATVAQCSQEEALAVLTALSDEGMLEGYKYRRLYEAMCADRETLNAWAAARGIVLPDTDTQGSEVAGYVVVSCPTDDDAWIEFGGRVFRDRENMPNVRGEFRPGRFFPARTATLVLLSEEA